jgi:hypothetical protein
VNVSSNAARTESNLRECPSHSGGITPLDDIRPCSIDCGLYLGWGCVHPLLFCYIYCGDGSNIECFVGAVFSPVRKSISDREPGPAPVHSTLVATKRAHTVM